MTADIATSLASWSSTAASNQPDNSDSVGPNILAENLRTIQSVVRDAVAGNGTIASATTTDLSTVNDGYIVVTGSTGPITSFGTVSAGIVKILQFSSTPTITHNATSMILPGGASITITADDILIMRSEGSGNWRCLFHRRGGTATDYALQHEYAPIIINHDGMINQRAAASNADDTYGFDRWNVLTQTGAVAESQITDVADETPYMMRTTQSQASAQRFGKCQILEAANAKRLRGKTITVAVKHKISSNANIRVAILEWTGTADAVTSDIVLDWTSSTYTANNFFLAANLTVTSVSSAIASTGTLATNVLTATVGSSCNNLIVFAWTEGTAAQNVTLDLAIDAKIGAYSASSFPFSIRGYGQERDLCVRYFERIAKSATGACYCETQAVANNEARGTLHYSEKRTAPTITNATYSNFYHTRASYAEDALTGAVTWYGISTNTASVVLPCNAALTAGDSGRLHHGTGTTFIDIAAEM